MDILFGTAHVTPQIALFRLAAALLAGSIIGFERSYRKQNAGLRTHILICLGAALLMLLSIWLPEQYSNTRSGDPGRIAAQVVSGIGFLGAGSMIRLGNTIKGLTTATSLWFVAACGLAIGAGMYIPAGFALILALFALVILDPVEHAIFPSERLKHIVIAYTGNTDFPEKARKVIEAFGLPVQSIDIEINLKKNDAEVKFLIGVPINIDAGDLCSKIQAIGGVEKIDIKEKF